jgi:hypothetical protein
MGAGKNSKLHLGKNGNPAKYGRKKSYALFHDDTWSVFIYIC